MTPRIEPQDLEIGQSPLNVAQPEVDEQEQQQQPDVAPVEQSLPEVAPQKSKRAKEVQEPAPVAGKFLSQMSTDFLKCVSTKN